MLSKPSNVEYFRSIKPFSLRLNREISRLTSPTPLFFVYQMHRLQEFSARFTGLDWKFFNFYLDSCNSDATRSPWFPMRNLQVANEIAGFFSFVDEEERQGENFHRSLFKVSWLCMVTRSKSYGTLLTFRYYCTER